MRLPVLRRLAPLLTVLALAGTAAIAEPPEYEEKPVTFYLNWDDCGADSQTYLDTRFGGLNGCGYIGGVPLNTPFAAIGDPITDSYSTLTRGVPFLLDASKTIDGEIHVHSWTGATGAGIGAVFIDGVLTGIVDSRIVTLGTFEGEAIATPQDSSVSVAFSFEIADHLDRQTVTSLTLEVSTWGLYVDSGTQAAGGLSKLTVPTLVEIEPED
jgi:hypothetical protein